MADKTQSSFDPDLIFGRLLGVCAIYTPIALLWNWVAPFLDPQPISQCQEEGGFEFGTPSFCEPDPVFRFPAWFFALTIGLFAVSLLWFAFNRKRLSADLSRGTSPAVTESASPKPSGRKKAVSQQSEPKPDATADAMPRSSSGMSRELRNEIYGVVGLVLAVIGLVQQLVG